MRDPSPHGPTPVAVIAPGGNALPHRGEKPEAANQARAARIAAEVFASVSHDYRLLITHGNGPKVGLLGS